MRKEKSEAVRHREGFSSWQDLRSKFTYITGAFISVTCIASHREESFGCLISPTNIMYVGTCSPKLFYNKYWMLIISRLYLKALPIWSCVSSIITLELMSWQLENVPGTSLFISGFIVLAHVCKCEPFQGRFGTFLG